MFKLQPENATFKAQVELTAIGSAETQVVEFEFRCRPASEIDRVAKKMQESGEPSSLIGLVAGWSGVDAEFSEEALLMMLDNHPATRWEIVFGMVREAARSRRKN